MRSAKKRVSVLGRHRIQDYHLSDLITGKENGEVKKPPYQSEVPPVFYVEEALAKYVETKPEEPEGKGKL